METVASVPIGRQTTIRSRLGRWPVGLAAIVGGTLVITGALLPWLTLLAGLRIYTGTAGLNGRLLLAGGAIATVAGLWFLVAGGRVLRWGIGLFGFALFAGATWLLLRLLATYQEVRADPFAIAALGPGLFVALGGAALIFVTLFLPDEISAQS